MRVRTYVMALAAITIAAAVTGASATAASARQIAKLKATEFAYEPKEVTVRPGEVVFDIENVGVIEHNFILEDVAKQTVGKVAVIAPGETEQVRVTLRAGMYTGYCDLPGHREAGMVAAVSVR
jgi:uncharacterized cupredoxin-like copper-binding protein